MKRVMDGEKGSKQQIKGRGGFTKRKEDGSTVNAEGVGKKESFICKGPNPDMEALGGGSDWFKVAHAETN